MRLEAPMRRTPGTWLGWLCGAIALLAGAVAAIGVLDRGDGSVVRVTSIRGVSFDMATTGVYANNGQRLVAEGIGWDVFTFVVAVPALLVGAWFVARGSFAGRLFTMGVLGYLLYQYLEYAVTWAIGPLFVPFVVLYAASLMAIVGIGWLVARDGVAGRFSQAFPRVGWTVLGVTMAVFLTVMWLGRIRVALDGDLVGAGLTSETTLTVQALDLGLMVPLLLLSAVLAWRRNEVGYALVCVLAVVFVGMAGAIVGMLLSAAVVEGVLEVVPVAIFGVAGLAGLFLGARAYRSIIPDVSTAPRPSLRHAGAPS